MSLDDGSSLSSLLVGLATLFIAPLHGVVLLYTGNAEGYVQAVMRLWILPRHERALDRIFPTWVELP